MQKYNASFILGIFIGLVLGLFAGKLIFETHQNAKDAQSVSQTSENLQPQKENPETGVIRNTDIPQKVYDVLKYIKANHHPMPGYVGGKIFSNREKLLPQNDKNGNSIQYQEWDVNPKVEGQNRGTERIVTGSDGRYWFTGDHYQTFKEIE